MIEKRKQPNGKIVSYLTTNSLWVKCFGEGGNGIWSPRNLKKGRQLCPNPDMVFDVGANIGQTAIEYADWAKEVWSFEPLPHLFEVAQSNVNDNNCSNVKLHQVAISDKHDTVKMVAVKSNDGQSHISPKGDYEVSAIPLDSLEIPEGRNVNYLKIDVEGHELSVIRGAKNLISKHKPIIQMECIEKLLNRAGTSQTEVISEVISLGYRAQTCGGKEILSSKEAPSGEIFFLPVK